VKKEVKSQMDSPFITLAEACAFAKISRMTLYRLRKAGLPTYVLGGKKYARIDELLALIKPDEETEEATP
jgi:predicted site-specific integrase-resolvase